MASHLATTKTTERNIPAGMIDDARKHVYEAAIRTPLVRLNYDGPAEIYLKLECLQPIGSFKIRGAYNAVRLSAGGATPARRLDCERGQRRPGCRSGRPQGRRSLQGARSSTPLLQPS